MRRIVKSLGLASWLALPATPAGAQVVVLHSFPGGVTDGANPQGALLLSGSSLYGTAEAGGSSADAGLVFQIGTTGLGYSVLYTFTNGSDGGNPGGSLNQSGASLYGLTEGAGSGGQGTIFKIGTGGTGFGVLHPFAGSPTDGGASTGTLASSGSTFFGYTSAGGSANDGTIFKINADGTGYNILHSFGGGAADGNGPVLGAPAISGTTLYGMTAGGGTGPGSFGGGVVYKIGTNGSGFTVLHSFTDDPTDGADPFGSVIVSGNTLYGMTMGGGAGFDGIIFKMNTDGTGFTILHSFTGGPSDGRRPLGDLLLSNSTLYGMTYEGGTDNLGTIFGVNTDGTGYDVLHSFLGGANDGSQPASDLILIGSTFYGTTVLGGAFGEGTVFSFTPVPEPSTLLLTAFAASAFFVRRLRGCGAFLSRIPQCEP